MMVNRLSKVNRIGQTEQQEGTSLLMFLNCCFAVASLCLMFLPIAQGYLAGSYYALFMAVTMGGWLATALCISRQWVSKLLPTAGLMLVLVLFYVTLVVLGFGNIRGIVTTVLPPYYAFFVAYFYYAMGKKRELSAVGLCLLVAFGITMITTISGLADDPYVYRESGGIETSLFFLKKNMGRFW